MLLCVRAGYYIRKTLVNVAWMKRSLGGANNDNEKDIIFAMYCMKFLIKAEAGGLGVIVGWISAMENYLRALFFVIKQYLFIKSKRVIHQKKVDYAPNIFT